MPRIWLFAALAACQLAPGQHLVDCTKPAAYLENIGAEGIDYHVSGHFHADHMG